ncbi:MAG: GNAT family N-acetyltransferase [Candidatus Berkiella sp.]
MQADYLTDPTLYTRCISLMDTCFPGIKALADQGRVHNAFWDKASVPFIVEKEKEIIAHLGVLPFDVIVDNQPFRGGALHGICTHQAHRRRGYFTQLIHEALAYTQQNFDFSFLFTDQPWLYEQFGFVIVPEKDFVLKDYRKAASGYQIRKCDLSIQDDLALMQSGYLNRMPISNRFGIVKETVVATLNALHQDVYYVDGLDVLVVYDIKENTLWLKDVVFKNTCELASVINAISGEFSNIILQFCPDKFDDCQYELIEAKPECCIMVSEEFRLGNAPFRYPEPQRC